MPNLQKNVAWWQAALCAACLFGVTVSAETVTPPPSAERTIAQLQSKLAKQPNDVATLHRLAEAMLVRARIKPDARETVQADAWIKRSLRLAPDQAKSWELQAWHEMNLHRFREALAAIERAQKIAPLSAVSLGLQADALVELGRYDEALAVTQSLIDRTPGLPAYSRAAHLRFLHGDNVGAIELMQSAVRAGRPRTEETAWALLQLSNLYLQHGQFEQAEQAAVSAKETFPGLAASPAQLGRIRIAQGRFDEALVLYQQAAAVQINPEYTLALYDLLQRLNRPAEAKRQAALLDAMARLDEKDTGLNRRLFAAYFADRPGGAAQAERLARLEMRSRPDIYSEDALAWALYRQGKTQEAAQHMEQALKLGTLDAGLQYHAAIIFSAAGQGPRADALMQSALQRNPHIAPLFKGSSS